MCVFHWTNGNCQKCQTSRLRGRHVKKQAKEKKGQQSKYVAAYLSANRCLTLASFVSPNSSFFLLAILPGDRGAFYFAIMSPFLMCWHKQEYQVLLNIWFCSIWHRTEGISLKYHNMTLELSLAHHIMLHHSELHSYYIPSQQTTSIQSKLNQIISHYITEHHTVYWYRKAHITPQGILVSYPISLPFLAGSPVLV